MGKAESPTYTEKKMLHSDCCMCPAHQLATHQPLHLWCVEGRLLLWLSEATPLLQSSVVLNLSTKRNKEQTKKEQGQSSLALRDKSGALLLLRVQSSLNRRRCFAPSKRLFRRGIMGKPTFLGKQSFPSGPTSV